MVHNGERIINKKKLIKNIEEIKKIIKNNKKICVMLKADAYGHGLEKTFMLIRNHVDFVGVSNINEAIFLRNIDKIIPILIVGKMNNFIDCIKYNVSFTIDNYEHLQQLIECIKTNGLETSDCRIKIHIKINVGMNRLGISDPHEFDKIYKKCRGNGIQIEGVFTHFSTADNDVRSFKNQVVRFKKFIDIIPNIENPLIHIGGSCVLLKQNEKVLKMIDFDMVRTGIFVFGYCADKLSKDIKPVLTITSKLIKVVDVKKNEYVGYSKKYMAEQDMRVGVVPLGYADGINRKLTGNIAVKVQTNKGKISCPIIGNVCMDMFFIDVTNSSAKEGDCVIVANDIKKWSQILGTIPYEVLTSFHGLR